MKVRGPTAKWQLSLLWLYYLRRTICVLIFLRKSDHTPQREENTDTCAVDWGIAMLCTWVQKEGFSDFYKPWGSLLFKYTQHTTSAVKIYNTNKHPKSWSHARDNTTTGRKTWKMHLMMLNLTLTWLFLVTPVAHKWTESNKTLLMWYWMLKKWPSKGTQ